MPHKTDAIVLGGGCFWCLEAIYQRVKGVESVTSGYAGGSMKDPNYQNHGNHAEVIQIVFDPKVISLETLLKIFWHIHDPTTLNRQGADVGESYRSIILCKDEQQKKSAEDSLQKVGQPLWDDPIVTIIQPLDTFYVAEDYHQNYYVNNPTNGYCQVVINPKLAKFEKEFSSLLT